MSVSPFKSFATTLLIKWPHVDLDAAFAYMWDSVDPNDMQSIEDRRYLALYLKLLRKLSVLS